MRDFQSKFPENQKPDCGVIYLYINYSCFIVESNILNVAYVCINYIMKSYARTYTKNGAHVRCEYIKLSFVFMNLLFLVIIIYKTWTIQNK